MCLHEIRIKLFYFVIIAVEVLHDNSMKIIIESVVTMEFKTIGF